MASVTDIAMRRRVYIRPALPPRLAQPVTRQQPSLVHRLALGLVWLAIASSAVVFTEPAPTDVLTMGLIVLLPVVGLAVFRPPMLVMGAALLVICGFGFIAALSAVDTAKATTHMAISLYLSLAAIVIAGFVARDPLRHTRLILRAYLAAALIAAVAALIGYFEVVPGAAELFTKFDRASGPFKDPNVFGPFLVPALVYALHAWFHRPLLKGLPATAAMMVLALAILLSFSRGAWAGAAVAVAVYLYFTFVTSRRTVDRFRIAALAVAGLAVILAVLATALQSDAVSDLFAQRANLAQSYDLGPEGRFGGQLKAIDALLENPFGIGALEFPRHYHHEDVHNVYLSMFLNAGWAGGLLFMGLALYTFGRGLVHALKRTRLQGYFLIAFASLTAILIQGLLIDIDHWRHFYALLGVVWGLMVSRDSSAGRSARIIADRRPVLLHPIIVLPPTRRTSRILGPAPCVIPFKPRPQRKIGEFNRSARLLAPIAPRRSPRMRLAEPEYRARIANSGNDNLPLPKR